MPLTKVHMEEGSKVKWDQGDCIGVMSDLGGPVPFYKSGEGNTFTSDIPLEGHKFYAFYPYSDSPYFGLKSDNDNPKILSFWNYKAVGGDNPSLSGLPMIAKSEGGSFAFKQTAGLLHFSITGTRTLKGVFLKGNKDEKLNGYTIINLEDDLPVAVCSGDESYGWASFWADDGIQLSEDKAFDLYFVLPPTVFEDGFNITISYADGQVNKSTRKEVDLSRGVVLSYKVSIDEAIQEADDYREIERNALIKLYNAAGGHNWNDNTNWCSDRPVLEWYGVYDMNGSGFVDNIFLAGNSLSGDIAEILKPLYELKELEILMLQLNPIHGVLPSDIDRLENVKDLELWDCNLSGTIPPEIGNLTNLEQLILFENRDLKGPIPSTIGNLVNAKWINLNYCNLTGGIPEEITNLHKLEFGFDTYGNPGLSGPVPDAMANWEYWNDFWGHIIYGTSLSFGNAVPHIPGFCVTLPDGSKVTSDFVKDNKLTILFQWATWCGYSQAFLPVIRSAYKYFKDMGLEILSWADPNDTEAAVQKYIADNGFLWPNFIAERIDPETGTGGNQIKGNLLLRSDKNAYYPFSAFPSINAFDSTGKLVFSSYITVEGDYTETFVPFMNKYFGTNWDPSDEISYESSDYSRDGEVNTIQSASDGNGINIVLMGDGYSDRLIADGSYYAAAADAVDAIFSYEPFAHYKSLFNIYSVNVVSKNEGVGLETALSTKWTGGDTVTLSGDHQEVFRYARMAVPEDKIDDTIIIVVMNLNINGGTCHMFNCPGGDYGRGASISYCPVFADAPRFRLVVAHEAVGHGFAKLADEYSLRYGQFPEEAIDSYRAAAQWGWWPNIDFTDDPATVKWSRFIGDERFASEAIGVYQGGLCYDYGVYRPTKTSIMDGSGGTFNAPSRYAIWYRIHKLAFGEEWTGSYEDFVADDLAHPVQSPASGAPRRNNCVERPQPLLSAPVVVGRSWREVNRKE